MLERGSSLTQESRELLRGRSRRQRLRPGLPRKGLPKGIRPTSSTASIASRWGTGLTRRAMVAPDGMIRIPLFESLERDQIQRGALRIESTRVQVER